MNNKESPQNDSILSPSPLTTNEDKRLKERLCDVRNLVMKKKTEIDEKTEFLEAKQIIIDHLDEIAETLENEIIVLKQDLEKEKAKIAILENENADLQTTLEDSVKTILIQKDEITKLQIIQMKVNNEKEKSNYEARIATLENENAVLQKNLGDSAEINSIQNVEIVKLQNQIIQMKETNEKEKSNNEAKIATLESEKADLQKTLKYCAENITRMKEQLKAELAEMTQDLKKEIFEILTKNFVSDILKTKKLDEQAETIKVLKDSALKLAECLQQATQIIEFQNKKIEIFQKQTR